ncbi:MAG: YvcK family protein [Bacillota bacterium]|nr:YvcK family protein [Bacillota bacterium]
MRVKRWLLSFAVGVALVVLGSVTLLDGRAIDVLQRWFAWLAGPHPGPFPQGLVTVAGTAAAVSGVLIMVLSAGAVIRSIVAALVPGAETRIAELVQRERQLGRGPRIVVVGGGTGLSTLLRGVKEFTSNVTAIVTVADDGGSSGRLRKEMRVLPPGDIRNCLVALADSEPLMARLFQYRFPEGDPTGLGGHTFGNLFIATMSAITGDFEQAVKESSRVLAVRGRVLPSTLEDVILAAECEGGAVVEGESALATCGAPIKRVFLRPRDPVALPEAVEAIAGAELILLGPGSLFTSVLPNLLVPGITEAVRRSRALKVYVCNVMTEPGETDGFAASDHLKAIFEHVGRGIVDVVLVNTGLVPAKLAERYRQEGAYPVIPDSDTLRALGVSVVEEDLMSASDYARHDPERLAGAIVSLVVEARASARGSHYNRGRVLDLASARAGRRRDGATAAGRVASRRKAQDQPPYGN